MGDDRRTEFWSTLGSLLRRKRVIIPAAVIAMTLGTVAYLGTPTTYMSSTTMILSPTEFGGTESQDPAKPSELSNPLLNFNDSLRTTSAILIQAMGTKDVADQLGVAGPTQLVINDGRTNPDLLGLNGPFLYIEATSTSSAAALAVVKNAQTLMREKLKEWQSSLNAPEKTFVSLVDIVPPAAPEPERGQAMKLGLMSFLFGFLLCIGIAYFLNQRRGRKRARTAATHLATASPAGEVRRDGRSQPQAAPAAQLPDDDAEDQDAEEDDEPTAVASSLAKPGPTVAPTFKKPEQRFPTRLQRKGDPFVRPVPLKQKVRSRNR
jgi:hypothetical protein